MNSSKWTKRFIIASIIQGLLIVILTSSLVIGQLYIKPEVSRVIAFGSSGMWFTFGYIMYLIVGVVGVAVSALFYHYLEDTLNLKYQGLTNLLAWLHLILMNVGITGASWLMMYGGYESTKVMLPKEVGGLGLTIKEAHEILAPLILPIIIFIGILIIGIIIGGIGFVIRYKSISIKEKKV